MDEFCKYGEVVDVFLKPNCEPGRSLDPRGGFAFGLAELLAKSWRNPIPQLGPAVPVLPFLGWEGSGPFLI